MQKTTLPEQRNIVVSKPKGVMIPGKTRQAQAPQLSNEEATFIVNKMLGN